MNRNSNDHFALNPTRLDMSRSKFNRSHSVKLTFNVGDVIPFYVDDVLPGDTFSIDTSKVVRMQTLLTPMMDNIYLDTYYFFVPNRLVWNHWENFCGENTVSPWIPSVEYSIPQIKAPSGGWSIGSIADYFGIPTGIPNLSVSALPFRAYALIMNDWFRDENLTYPLNIPVNDATVTGVNPRPTVADAYIQDTAKGGAPFKAAKFFDRFTGSLPAPQKGPDVTIPVATAQNLPVVPLAQKVDASILGTQQYSASYLGVAPDGNHTAVIGFGQTGQQRGGQISDGYGNYTPIIDNLWAIQSGTAPAATINQLRTAFQIQKFYERQARGGTRYIEILKSHFGVTSPDSRLQRPEYLGGNRVPININQVIQTSETSADGTPQGNTAAMSLTTDRHSDFTHSFVEHGYLIGVMVARYDHTYQQGIPRHFSRKTMFDFYWPVFANLGEQPVYNQEIYAQGTSQDTEVFGYQEAWSEYRYKDNRVCGEMRSSAPQSLDVWHLADYYTQLPALSDSWIREDGATVDRVLAVSSRVSDQLFADIYIKNICTRPMPLYSVPGLIDHH